MIGFVYIWINKINGKKYIGFHKGLETDNYIGSGVVFKKAIKKYGIENFERKILYREYESLHNLYLKENEIINAFNAVFSSEYYNLSNYDPKYPIGENKTKILSELHKEKLRKPKTQEHKNKQSKIMLKKWKTEEYRKKRLAAQNPKKIAENIERLRIFNTGKKLSTERKQQISERVKGKNNPFYGKKHSEETIKKIQESHKGRFAGAKNPAAKQIEVNGVVYDTIRIAMKSLNLSYKKIKKVGNEINKKDHNI